MIFRVKGQWHINESNHSVKVVTGGGGASNFEKIDLYKFPADAAATFVRNLSVDSDPTFLVSEYNNKMKEFISFISIDISTVHEVQTLMKCYAK